MPLTTAVPMPTLPVWEIIVRLLCAVALGMIVGTEREYSRHPAGMRTHTLVALGACTVMITGQLVFQEYFPLGASPDPARLAAQVIAGVGFLGAGTILRDGVTVKGLTTAASIWVVACLGVAVGAGHYVLALTGAAMVIAILTCVEYFQKRFLHRRNPLWQVTITTTDVAGTTAFLPEAGKAHRVQIDSMQMDNLGDGSFKITFQVEFGDRHWEARARTFWAELGARPEVTLQRVRECSRK